ncbi:MAG TPA: hypothetical protein VK203_16170 [Nostocaceae cyanobacterium]|nr:hypothetical protein [Nostocaceae cyanobacterium]
MKTGIKQRNYGFWLVACWLLTSLGFDSLAIAQAPNTTKKAICQEQDLETLTTYLLRDLPGYANRATQRARRLSRQVDIFPYVLVAGKPEFQPLPLNPGLETGDRYASEGVEQVFFTTLERQYINSKAVESQQFHRLFLTKTQLGWQVVTMYTQTGQYPVKQPVSPPRESSDSAIGQGVKTWLRDCEAGSVRM